ncbi:hypothetical protein Nepgr_020429 [Nepenthes gracilis]|uniref:Uncharacterized protein n=1 Tax=Nepenthes gracilis TaxID=150966 RepID=A0AAD3SV21_NEPGR|nr:hypothetical protein Nepgr_020429 [Nepenthes gracilis]
MASLHKPPRGSQAGMSTGVQRGFREGILIKLYIPSPISASTGSTDSSNEEPGHRQWSSARGPTPTQSPASCTHPHSQPTSTKENQPPSLQPFPDKPEGRELLHTGVKGSERVSSSRQPRSRTRPSTTLPEFEAEKKKYVGVLKPQPTTQGRGGHVLIIIYLHREETRMQRPPRSRQGT